MFCLNGYRMRLVLLGISAMIVIGVGPAKADFVIGDATSLGPQINSQEYDYDPTISSDGLLLIFGSTRSGGIGGYDLWTISRATTDDPWGKPQNIGAPVNSEYGDADPSLSADGLSLYFRSNRPGGFGNEDIWVTTRETADDPWCEPVNVGPPVNSVYDESDPLISPDGLSLYFSEWAFENPEPRPGGSGGSDIWVATRPTRDAPWGDPINLGPAVNSPADDFMGDIADNGLTLFLCSDRGGGLGSFDIYMVRRMTASDPWREPVNLGASVNSFTYDENPELSADGTMLYFDTARTGQLDLCEAPIQPIVDFNGDCIVDAEDMCIMVDNWGTDNSLCDIGPMPWGDGIVDVEDMKVLADHLFEEVDDPTLIAHWPMDETEGMYAVDIIGNNDALVLGGIEWQPAGGQIDGALKLDGVSGYAVADEVLNPADGKFSIITWVKGGAPGQVLLSQINGTNWLCTDLLEGNLVSELQYSGRYSPLMSDAAITDGQWHRIGFVWDGSQRRLYVDGVIVAEDTQTGLASSNGGLYIGCGKGMESNTFFSGLIDDVRIYNRAVSP